MFACLTWYVGCFGRSIRIFFFLLFFAGPFCVAQERGLSNSIALLAQSDDHSLQIEQFIKKTIVLEHFTYHADVRVDPEEFFHLVDLQEGVAINSADVQSCVKRLFEKNKFERIELELKKGVTGMHLHFKLFGFWTLAKIKLHGIVIGKEKYRQYYLMNSGDPFDIEKHRRSLERIRQAFRNEGYFEGVASDELERETATKSIIVHLSLSRGPRCRIGQILVSRTRVDKENEESDELERILSRLNKRLSGRSYSKGLLNKEIEKLKLSLCHKGFLQIHITLSEKIRRAKKTVDLSFTFDFLEKRAFVFFGNSFFSNAHLLDVLLVFGDSVRLVPAPILAEEVEKEYHKKGFWSVRVTSREEPQRDFFLICEGPRASIREVELKGVNSFDNKKVVRYCFRALVRKRFFDQEALNACLSKLAMFYQAQGFWNMRVLNQEMIKLDTSNGDYKLQLVIEEGNRTFLRSVQIPDFPEFLVHRPFARFFKEKSDHYFDPQYLEEQRSFLKKQLHRKGYMNAEARANLTRDGNDVAVCWDISKGDPAPLFGKTVMLGSCTFPFDVVARSLCYQEGQVWDDAKLKMSAERLRSLGVFEQVHLYPAKDGICGEQKDLLLKLHKDDPFELRFRAGFGLQGVDRYFRFDRGVTYKLGGTFFVKNPLNAADCFAIDADFARSRRHLNIEYTRPYLFGLPALIKCKGYITRYEQPGFVGSKRDLYEVLQQGFLIGAREKRRYFDVGLNIGVEWMATRIKNGMEKFAFCAAQAINFRSELLGQKIPYFFIEPIVFVDRLDNKANPTDGTFTLVTFKGMFSLSSKWQCATFMKVMGEHSIFHPIVPLIAGALHFRIGHIFFQSFENIMPFERFYLGGAHSIRAYEADLCPPICRFTDCQGNCYVVPQGGKTLVQVNAELRFPIWNDIGGVVFQDIGTLVGQPSRKFDFSSLLAATGFGVRYNTPIGFLRFDIGWKWCLNHPSDHSYAWFLALGQAF